MSETRKGPLPPLFFFGALVVQGALHAFAPGPRLFPEPWAWLGAIPLAAGIAVMVNGNRQFQKADTAISPFDTPSTLVSGGVFRFSRNPMYLGMVAALIGAAIAWGTLAPMLMPWLFGWIISTRFIRLEEQVMRERFGPEYEGYCRSVRRWL